jgi:hypothetical protein
MSVNNLTNDKENDFAERDDSYKGNIGAINPTGIGGTTSAGETFDRIGTAAAEFNDADVNRLDRGIGNSSDELDNVVLNEDSPMKWVVPLIILFLLIIIGYSFCSKPPASTTGARNAVKTAKLLSI